MDYHNSQSVDSAGSGTEHQAPTASIGQKIAHIARSIYEADVQPEGLTLWSSQNV